ncbi:MAG: PAS domain-containing protein [Gemmatimonadota bacterium]|nr:PAS domain-containing protein [Gemmatimonadota bacterium]
MNTPTESPVDRTRPGESRRGFLASPLARRDFAIGVGIAAISLVLLIGDLVDKVLPFLAPHETTSHYTDELLFGIIVATTLGFLWAYRRGEELRRALRDVASSRQLAELGFDRNPLASAVLDLETLRFLAINETALHQYGYSRAEFLERLTGPDLSPRGLRDAAYARMSALAGGTADLRTVTQHLRKDGSALWVELSHRPLEYLGRRASIFVALDVTAREEMAARQRALDARFRAVFETDAAGIVEVDATTARMLAANEAFARLVGRTREELSELSVYDLTHPDDLDESRKLLALLASGQSPRRTLIKRYVRPDGTMRWALTAAAHVRGGDTPLGHNIAVAVDVTDQRLAEEARELLRERLALTLDAVGEGLWDWNVPSGEMFFSPSFLRILDLAPHELPGRLEAWSSRIHPSDGAKVDAAVQAHLAGETLAFEVEYRLKRRDGSWVWVLDRGRVVRRDAEGRAERMVGTIADISARRDLEDQLRQAQKMEAVGQLAGGVAHDFNNLLTVIRTGLELALSEPLSAETRADLQEVELATQRATDLTSQLLAFSRRRLSQPRLMSLNDAVVELGQLLSRVLPEDIDVRRRLEAHAHVLADPGNLGQSLLNIAVNARDAMPEGGVLTLATFDATIAPNAPECHDGVPPGSYSVVSVGDTGIGMSADVRAHIFEPFFTTKPVGKGTGLGLASVYGIVKQMAGHLRVESAAGVGTKFLIYLPVAPIDAETGTALGVESTPGGTEHVLVVEDDPAVRAVAVRMLAAHGYLVEQAGDGAQAIARLNADATIACVVADVVMPVMAGNALAAQMRQQHPHVALVVMSAHSHDVLAQFPLPDGIDVLAKPFTTPGLLRAVRKALDAKRTAPAH